MHQALYALFSFCLQNHPMTTITIVIASPIRKQKLRIQISPRTALQTDYNSCTLNTRTHSHTQISIELKSKTFAFLLQSA